MSGSSHSYLGCLAFLRGKPAGTSDAHTRRQRERETHRDADTRRHTFTLYLSDGTVARIRSHLLERRFGTGWEGTTVRSPFQIT
eukprot:1502895-Rhodomonas_salina.1